MKLVFCTKYGFDEHKRKARLSALGLGIDEVTLAEQVQRHVIQPNLDEIVAGFFRVLRLDDEVSRVFSRGFRDDKLQHFMANYLVSIGAEFDQPAYFEQRLRMGIAHVNAGVSLVVFQIGYRLLQQLLMDLVPPEAKNADLLRAFMLKITTLDLIIATEVYQKYRAKHTLDDATEHPLSAQMSRGSLRKLLDDEQVSELLLTGLQSSEAGIGSCLAVAKIDEIAKIEQVYGKETVDLVRQGLTARLLATLRPGDGVGLVSAGSFVFVLSHTTPAIGEDICKRLMMCVSQHPVSADKMTIPVTISLVLMFVETNAELKTGLSRLEQQLTQIQAKGVNQLEFVNDIDENNGAVGC